MVLCILGPSGWTQTCYEDQKLQFAANCHGSEQLSSVCIIVSSESSKDS